MLRVPPDLGHGDLMGSPGPLDRFPVDLQEARVDDRHRVDHCRAPLFEDRPDGFPLARLDIDEEGVGGDDAADTLRYLVATKAREIGERKLRGV